MYRFVWTIELNEPVTPESEVAFMDHWRAGSEILQEYPGALGTHLHRIRDGKPGSFFLVAEWQSQEARDAMSDDANLGDSERAKRWQQLPPNESFGKIMGFAGLELEAVMPLEQPTGNKAAPTK